MPLDDSPDGTSEVNRWLLLARVAGSGLILVVVGFAYGMTMAGLPYQDPTPEIQARWEFHTRIGQTLCLSGLVVLALALAGTILNAAWSLGTWGLRGKKPRKYPD